MFEYKKRKIFCFDIKGKHLQTIDLDRNIGDLETPYRILVDNIGDLIYVQCGPSRIDIYDAYGYFISTRKLNSSISDFCVDGDGYLVGDTRQRSESPHASFLSKIDINGEIFEKYAKYEHKKLVQTNIDTYISHDILISRLEDNSIVYGWAGAY